MTAVTEQIADELNDTARSLRSTDLNRAMRLAREANEISRQLNYEKGMADSLRNMGHVTLLRNQIAEASQFFTEALVAFRKINSEKGIAMSLNDLGGLHLKISDYVKSSEYFFASLKLKEKIDDKKGMANTLLNLGSVYQKQRNFKKSLNTFRHSLRIARKLNEQSIIISIENNMGEVFIAQRKPKQALESLSNAAELCAKTNDKIRLASVYNNIGSAWLNLKQHEKAMEAFKQSIAISSKEKLRAETLMAKINIGEIHSQQKKFPEAEKILFSAMKSCKKDTDKRMLVDIYEKISGMYTMQNEFKKAVMYLRRYHQTQMQVLSKDNIRQTAELAIQYEVAQKEKEAEIFRLKNVELKDALNKLGEEKKRSDNLLKNILPDEVAEDLKTKGKAPVHEFKNVSVMFIDIKDFTVHTEKMNPELLVDRLGLYFTAFENITEKYGIEKIKTIGDAFLCACGIPKPVPKHAEKMVLAAFEIIAFANQQKEIYGSEAFRVRVGIHSGPVIAGIIGSKKFAYDIWGDTVNTAARMEQSSEPGRINISNTTYELIRKKFTCIYRGKLPAKNKGEVDMYFVEE